MNRKKLILIVLGLGAVAYLLFKKKKAQPPVQSTEGEPAPELVETVDTTGGIVEPVVEPVNETPSDPFGLTDEQTVV